MPCWESRIMTRRQPTRWGPCSRCNRSQGSSAGQAQLAYTLGGRILAAASSGCLVCGSSNDRRGYLIGGQLDPNPGLRAKLLVSCLAPQPGSVRLIEPAASAALRVTVGEADAPGFGNGDVHRVYGTAAMVR